MTANYEVARVGLAARGVATLGVAQVGVARVGIANTGGGGSAPVVVSESMVLQENQGVGATVTTVTVSLRSTAKVGSLLTLNAVAGRAFTAAPIGWLPVNSTINVHAAAMWYRKATGTVADQAVINVSGGTANIAWIMSEHSNINVDLGPVSSSAINGAATGASTFSCSPITPPASNAVIIGAVGFTLTGGSADDCSQWWPAASHPFMETYHVGTTLPAGGAGIDKLALQQVYAAVAGDGATAYTYTGKLPLNVTGGAVGESGIVATFVSTATAACNPSTLATTRTGAILGGSFTTVSRIDTTADNQIFENLICTGRVTINNHNNITLRNCIIQTTDPFYGLIVDVAAVGFIKNLKIEFCSFVSANDPTVGTVNGAAISGALLRRCSFSNFDNFINVFSAQVSVFECYGYPFDTNPTAHQDGLENNGVTQVWIAGCYFVNQLGETSALMQNNEFGPVNNIYIDNNFLAGGGYTIYFDGGKSGVNQITAATCIITNNIVHQGLFGWLDNNATTVDFGAGNQLLPPL